MSELFDSSPLGSSEHSASLLKNRYEIRRKLGEGGFAETHLAYDHRSNELCVIKELSWKKVDDWKLIELFEREAKVLSNLNHPQIPKFIEFFSERTDSETKIYLVQEFIQGKNLAELVQEGKHFTEKEIVQIALNVTKVLEYLHALSPPIIHRDIKPSNLLLDSEDELHLVDFGAVRDKVLHTQKTEAAGFTIVGTYGYMPFEQFQGQALPASDIFSLGATLVYLLTHREPQEITAPNGVLEFEKYCTISQDFQKVLRKMTEPQLDKRYASATELRKDLLAILEGKPLHFEKPTVLRKWYLLGGAALAVLMIFLLTNRTVVQQPPQPVRDIKKVEAPKLETPLAQPVSAQGEVLFDGKPITETTDLQPRFWFRNEKEGTEQNAKTSYTNGKFLLRGLPPGQYGLSLQYDLNPKNPPSYPGDLRAWETFTVQEGNRAEIQVNVHKIIHMTQPQDNGTQMAHWGAEVDGMISFSPKLTFQWDSLGNDVYYDYHINRVQAPYKSIDTVSSGTTQNTSLELKLPPNNADEYYILRLSARKDGREIGLLMTHGHNGYGWDYRFRVK